MELMHCLLGFGFEKFVDAWLTGLPVRDRGPAKGYTEALETRLKETERVLWRVLSVAPTDSLTTAFSPDVQNQTPASLSISTLERTEEKKSAVAFWERFPLQTIEDLLAWKTELESASAFTLEDIPLDHAGNITVSDPRHRDSEELAQGTLRDVDDGGLLSATDEGATSSNHSDQSSAMAKPNTQRGAGPRTQRPLAPATVETLRQGGPSNMSQSGRRITAGEFGLSKEFRDTFLW